MTIESFPEWTPPELSEWICTNRDKYPAQEVAHYERLARDDRMKDVWEWHESIRDNLELYEAGYLQSSGPEKIVSLTLIAMIPPGKPGNMPPTRRERYFENVRHHARALMELLQCTRYDCAWNCARDIDLSNSNEEEIKKTIGDRVMSYQRYAAAEDADLLIAFRASRGGLIELPWDYPDSHVTEILHKICEWTYQDDYWERTGLVSSTPIRQTGENARIIYFTCTLYEKLARGGVEIPFSTLATIANVALDLPADRPLEEDTVRKQVRRHVDHEVIRNARTG